MEKDYFVMKHDLGKPRMDLLPFEALERVAEIMTYGAEKYSENSWRDIPDAKKRYIAALLRHLSKFQQGEEFDTESGLTHLDHMACNAIFLCALQEKDNASR